jgi:hypothetical protein
VVRLPSLGHGLDVHSEAFGDPAVFGIKLQGFQSRVASGWSSSSDS